MNVDDLLRSGRIRREDISRDEVRHALARARRDLKVARKLMADDWDWAFSIAYDAVFQASRAFMFAHGFRPASKEAHKNAFAFMLRAVGKEHRSLIRYFDRARVKRHRAIYDIAGIITETEARNLLRKATEFVEQVARELDLPRGRKA